MSENNMKYQNYLIEFIKSYFNENDVKEIMGWNDEKAEKVWIKLKNNTLFESHRKLINKIEKE